MYIATSIQKKTNELQTIASSSKVRFSLIIGYKVHSNKLASLTEMIIVLHKKLNNFSDVLIPIQKKFSTHSNHLSSITYLSMYNFDIVIRKNK